MYIAPKGAKLFQNYAFQAKLKSKETKFIVQSAIPK